jgi:hypothetical protein
MCAMEGACRQRSQTFNKKLSVYASVAIGCYGCRPRSLKPHAVKYCAEGCRSRRPCKTGCVVPNWRTFTRISYLSLLLFMHVFSSYRISNCCTWLTEDSFSFNERLESGTFLLWSELSYFALLITDIYSHRSYKALYFLFQGFFSGY